MIPIRTNYALNENNRSARRYFDHEKRDAQGISQLYLIIFSYVGIIQIRLQVETDQFPLSQLLPAPFIFDSCYYMLFCSDNQSFFK